LRVRAARSQEKDEKERAVSGEDVHGGFVVLHFAGKRFLGFAVLWTPWFFTPEIHGNFHGNKGRKRAGGCKEFYPVFRLTML
jgi:hypothetical protein